MDIYIDKLWTLVENRDTFVAHLPRDIIGILRSMYSTSYEIDSVADLVENLRQMHVCHGNEYINMLLMPRYEKLLLHNESQTNRIDFWADLVDECNGLAMKRRVLERAGELHGGDFSMIVSGECEERIYRN